ncbi:MAG: U32 family peptidase [[Eubacterium] siraeum]|nr:U32 family peptidase [[Eubacterium] siraeum]
MLEILAPCGTEESLEAALNSGADAVYLGLTSFSARRNAANFTPEQLKAAVGKAHRQGVRVYVAVNTLVFDDELSQLKNAVLSIAEAKADGAIIQDLGAVKLFKEYAPDIRLHASTQMTVTSASGAEFVKKQGFSRVVLPRELSLEEIRSITSRVDIETEVFVHGALCVCLSGQCLLSAAIGGRSGNRGLCAQPCRLNYRCGDRENVLSLKDLSIIENLRQLEQAGVVSAKIEGRMKRPEYAAAAVSRCKASLRGEKTDTELLRSVFSRSGFTKGYYSGDLANMQGIRQREDTENTAEALAELKQLCKSPCKRFSLDMELEITAQKPVSCTARCGEITVTVWGEIPQRAQNKSLTADDVVSRMKKLGNTVFEAGSVACRLEEGLFLPAAALNRLRRDITEEISEKIAKKTENS